MIAALVFWELANVFSGTQEPWDAPHYLGFYLTALGISATLGYLFDERLWRWGLIVIFAQLPVMMLHSSVGPLLIVGLIFLTVQTLPAIIIAIAASHLRKLRSRS